MVVVTSQVVPEQPASGGIDTVGHHKDKPGLVKQ